MILYFLPQIHKSKNSSPKGESKGNRNWEVAMTMIIIQRDFSPKKISPSFLRSSIPRPRRIDTIQLPAREKKGIQEKQRFVQPTVVSPSSSFVERTRNERGRGGEMDAGPRRLALIRWLGGNDKERKIIGLSVAALFNPLPPRGELFLSALGERERERREGWSVRRKKDPEEVVSFRRFSFSHRCRRRRSPSLSLSFFSLFFLPRPLHTRSSPSLI